MLNPSVFVMRGYVGDLVFHFDKAGKAIGLDLYREWLGPKMKPGETVECSCTEEFVHLDCPIHAVALEAEQS